MRYRAVAAHQETEKSGLASSRSLTLALAADLGVSAAIALALDGDDVAMVDDPIDECGGAGGIGKNRGPFAEVEVGSEDDTLLLIPSIDNLEEQIGIAVVVGEIAKFVDAQQLEAAVVAESAVESACGFGAREVEKEFGGRDEEGRMTGLHGAICDVLGQHGLAQALGSDQYDIAILGEEVESEGGFDESPVDSLGPVPVEVAHWFE